MNFLLRVLSLTLSLACLVSPTWGRPAFKKCDYRARNFNTISSIYNLTVYPNQVPIIFGGAGNVPDGLFSHSVAGRVYPVGNFKGFEDSIEYFFALAPLPQGNIKSAAITSYKITSFTSGCRNVAASVVYLYSSVVDPASPDFGKPLAPLKQVAFWRFDGQGAVVKYDAWIPSLDRWIELIDGTPSTDPTYEMQTIQRVCATAQLTCSGPNQQWGSVEECVADLSQRKYGSYSNAWGDNIVCRTIHLVLTQARPDHHCPHVGPTGGGKCVDVPYPEDFLSDEDLYGDLVGETFTC
ncbi:uncharacterized protein DNG_03201 [Cephalotrichum gorgonifer]|uniref:Uncharacterized protein n=1 Tax=Cephalotrichum gorgonifer TaxID=2041049 RepID=A0AAE8MTS7_9PEZI|nr:uncharacterized protein DNG_03201 [Cephalotrichum gorgonifer]